MSERQNAEEEDGILEVRFLTVSASRLKGFSDAVWSIIATIMIVPTMHVNISEVINEKGTKSIDEVVLETLPQVGLYFLAFLIVCSTWTCHVWTFQTMKKVTDLSLVLNLGVLLAGSFLPYFYSLMARFRTWRTVIIYASIQISIGLIQVIVVLHAFSYPKLLSNKLNEVSEEQKLRHRRRILSHIVVAPAFAFCAILLSFASAEAAIVCLGLILAYPWIQSFTLWAISKAPKCRSIISFQRRDLQRQVLLTERIKKERIEAFGDGVFAITSTLLALDLTEKYLPTQQTLSKKFGGQPMQALASTWGVFLSYLLTFILIGLIWYTHLHMFRSYEKISRLMLFFNNWILACVGMIPLAFTFILHFKIASAVKVGLQFGCIALFFVGVFTALMYIAAILFDRCHQDEIWVSKSIQPGGKDFWFTMFQLIVSPLSSAFVFGLTFLSDFMIAAYVGAPMLVVYGIIILSWKTVYASCFEKEEVDQRGSYRTLRFSEEIAGEVKGTDKEEE